MAAIDGATKSLLQGVSQQVPRERLDGQVSLQVNMLSDPVEGMRRRPGMRLFADGVYPEGGWNKDQIFATSVDVESSDFHVMINTASGLVLVYNEDMTLVASDTSTYLQAPTAASIQVAALRGHLYIANTTVTPTKVVDNSGRQDPAKTGFFFIKTGQYSKTYTIYLTLNGVQYTQSYTTPDGTHPGDAAASTPDFITSSIVGGFAAQSIAGLSLSSSGAYTFVNNLAGGVLTVASDSGTTFVGVSNQSHVSLTTDLPAKLTSTANNMLVSVGANPKLSVWYKYSFAENSWVEAGAYNSATALQNMPVRLSLDGLHTLEELDYEGRLAGSDETNEDPAFLTGGITGMGVFQGRLVLLSQATVCMSAAGKPLRWYRSTITELLVADPIQVFSGAATTALFTHAVQFNKDLLLFSKTCQAVVPSGNSIITPSTAQIAITSAYSCTDRVTPVVAGRSLLYFAPRSEQFAAVLEMVPSNTTDSQYTTNDVTAHLPRYMPGTIRQATASTTSNSLAIVSDGDARSVFIYQYLWGDDSRIQAAWHSWTAPYDVVCTWFLRDTVYIGMKVGNALVVTSVAIQAGEVVDGMRRPFSDVFAPITVSGGTFAVPAVLRPAVMDGIELQLTYATGPTAGEALGFSLDETTWVGTVVRNVPDGVYMLGLKYRSVLAPTPPLMRDRNGVVIGTSAVQLIRYEASLKNTGAFNVLVQRNDTVVDDGTYSGLLYSSEDLSPGQPLYSPTSHAIIPVRLNANVAVVTLYVEEDHDLGVLTLEHVMQYYPRRRRM